MEKTMELKRIGTGAAFVPATAPRTRAPLAQSLGAAEALLEGGFHPDVPTLTSFLVNAFYLVGDHDVMEWTPRDGRVAAELAKLGHRLAATFPATLRAAQSPSGRLKSPPRRSMPRARHDRVMSLARPFGVLPDADNAAWLRAMHRLLRPGGLLCFHVVDRDRAWSRVGENEGGAVSFDPASGRLTARLKAAGPGSGAAAASLRTYNLAEIGALLEAAGFALERAYGDWDGGNVAEAGAATGRIIVVAAKPRRKRVTRKVLPAEPGGEGGGT
jgi:hypothetical protein